MGNSIAASAQCEAAIALVIDDREIKNSKLSLLAERDLMASFKRQFPQQIHTVNYEELVGDSVAVARKLFGFCGLEFKSKYLDISKNQSSAATASASQVRQGIYPSSVDNWRNYEKYLQPVIDVLQKKQLF